MNHVIYNNKTLAVDGLQILISQVVPINPSQTMQKEVQPHEYSGNQR